MCQFLKLDLKLGQDFFWNILLPNVNVCSLAQYIFVCIILWKLKLWVWIQLKTNPPSEAMIKYLESSLLAKNVTNLKPIIDTISSWQIIICSSFSRTATKPLFVLPGNAPPFEDFERFYQCARTKIQTKPSFFDLQQFQALLLCKKGCLVCRDLMADLSLVPS